MSLKRRITSFKHAFRGMAALFSTQPNARIHVVAAILAVGLALILNVELWEWIAIILCIGIVFFAEAVNTAIEALCDVVQPEHDVRIKRIKDVAAASVLFAALVSAVTGLLVFGRHLLRLFPIETLPE